MSANSFDNHSSWLAGVYVYYFSGLIAILGGIFGHEFLKPARHPLSEKTDLLASFANWDGRWYAKIVEEGHRYDPEKPSSVAFFPGLPVLAETLVAATGMRADMALLIVAHLCLVGAFVLFAGYVGVRAESASGGTLRGLTPPGSLAGMWTLLAFAFWPTGVFARVAYSESLFLLTIIAALYGLERKWPLWTVALIAGAATGTRSVGVALMLPLGLELWRQSASWREMFTKVWVLPLACWGLVAYMGYQAWEFNEPLAFVKTQENWNMRANPPLAQRIYELATLQPCWAVYDSESQCYWGRHAAEVNPLFSLHFANPLFWLGAVVLVAVGAWRRWLSANEALLAAALLWIPYVLRSREMCMAGMGRFAFVAFPVYLVVGQILSRLPKALAIGLLAVCGFFLGIYAALFAAWYRIF